MQVSKPVNLRGKQVLVTGGSKGVGAAMANEFSSRGARVTLAARPSDQLNAVAASTGSTASPLDLADFDALDGFISRVEKANGPIDVLVNNAALVTAGRIDSVSRSDLQTQINVNLLAPMELCRQALPGMLERGGGTVVNVSSMVAELGIPNLPAYVAAKAGLTKFTLDLQGDLRRSRDDVAVLLVVLGEIPGTQINSGFREDPAVSALADKFGKLPVLSPELVARTVADRVALRQTSTLVLPRYNAPIVGWRHSPIRLTNRLASSDSSGRRTEVPPATR
ncbi:SDR family NAD(P)-dependent oxidoreductase [Mycobacterium avium]|uniref:SDR family NAD(P)-dependent oxidoreductase n=1 Tax=Mycobacterium avium TaxID=1764 RepID=UPI00111BFC5F|nr:SDR family oxidoreductase [Mycobacterium avium]